MQMREKVGKSRNTVFFQWFVAPEGRKVMKSRFAKAAGAEPSGQMRHETSLPHWFIDSSAHYFIIHIIHWLIGSLLRCCFIDSPIPWFIDWFIVWFIDSVLRLVHRFICSLIQRFIGSLIHSVSCAWVHAQFSAKNVPSIFFTVLTHSWFELNFPQYVSFSFFLLFSLPITDLNSVSSIFHKFHNSDLTSYLRLKYLPIATPCDHPWIMSLHWRPNNLLLIRWCISQLQHFVASASQKLSYRPSSSYSCFICSKLLPQRGLGTAWYCTIHVCPYFMF